MLVVLGDPGAGKSTLARYLLLTSASLPLLVELRTYAHLRCTTFLDLIDHLHRTQDVGLPRTVLEPLLDAGAPVLVIFDGLDEVFDPRLRAEVTAQIEGFAARYPKTRIVVTSRLIGYQRQMLDNAGFAHWVLQDLDRDQIGDFTAAWYRVSCPSDEAEAARLRDRLLSAVGASTAVSELAGNPMLLTILAIIGRRRELPRDRRSVYEHAVTVLVEHWDVNKHLRDERVTIDYLDARDKLELLHLVARHMQDAPAGLAGNHVAGPVLTELFRGYLEERFALPPDRSIPAARAILAQFRERNVILARFGSEVYGFVHRAFLEYLAAEDLTRRLTNLDLTQEALLDTYDRRWNDPAWTEVLLLLTGMIPDRLAIRAIARLLDADPHWGVRSRLPRHLFLALQAMTEIRRSATLAPLAADLTQALTRLLEKTATSQNSFGQSLGKALARLQPHLSRVLVPGWPAAGLYQDWYRRSIHQLAGASGNAAARIAASMQFSVTDPDLATLHRHLTSPNWPDREAAVRVVAAGRGGDPSVLQLLRNRAKGDRNYLVRRAAVEAVAAGWPADPHTLSWLRERAVADYDSEVRQAAVQAIATGWADDPDTLPWLRGRATTDQDTLVRFAVVQAGRRHRPGRRHRHPPLAARASHQR